MKVGKLERSNRLFTIHYMSPYDVDWTECYVVIRDEDIPTEIIAKIDPNYEVYGEDPNKLYLRWNVESAILDGLQAYFDGQDDRSPFEYIEESLDDSYFQGYYTVIPAITDEDEEKEAKQNVSDVYGTVYNLIKPVYSSVNYMSLREIQLQWNVECALRDEKRNKENDEDIA